MNLGIDELSKNYSMLKQLNSKRCALLGHPASVNSDCIHTMDVLDSCSHIDLASAFGPQHGMKGDKQDNMIESDDYTDALFNIPVFSLYGNTRRPSKSMLDSFDVLIVDIQDIGTRIYTFITTLLYLLEACAEENKKVYILDRPNPAGRPVEGTILEKGWESFVGAAQIIMRHGLTIGELARYFVTCKNIDVDLNIISMSGYNPDAAPNFGWPKKLSWVNPSPNASGLNMVRCYPGTVLFEATNISEGRGTTTPLEIIGHPDIDFNLILKRMKSLAPKWLTGCQIRQCWFEPTFDQFQTKLCSGIQIHTDNAAYNHNLFKPYRLASCILKSIRIEYPDYEIWRDFQYEYESDRPVIDFISGGTFLREWVDDTESKPGDLESRLFKDENEWTETRKEFLAY